MTGLKMQNGDLVITNHEIEQVQDEELTSQTIESVLSTNKGEWLFDEEEGIEFSNFLGHKNIDENIIRSEIEQGIAQVDETLTIDEFECQFDSATRKQRVKFTAKNSNDESVEVNLLW